jgi:hypothetical protein
MKWQVEYCLLHAGYLLGMFLILKMEASLPQDITSYPRKWYIFYSTVHEPQIQKARNVMNRV